MPDGRFVARSISHSEQLANVSLSAAFLFTWCIPHLDVEGRMAGHPQLVKSIACPLRPEILPAQIPNLLCELAQAGLLVWYEVDGTKVLQFPGFRRQQRGLKPDREAKSKFAGFEAGAINLCASAHAAGLAHSTNGTKISNPDPLGINSGSAQDEVRPSISLSVSEVEVEDEVKNPAAAASCDNPTRTREANGGSSGGDERELAQLAMSQIVDDHAATVTDSTVRKRFVASAIPLVDGSDHPAWADVAGTQVPWPERPRLLHLAIAHMAGNGGRLRSALRYVIPQQLAPYPTHKSNHPHPDSPAAQIRDELPRNGQQRNGKLRHLVTDEEPTGKATIEAQRIAEWAAEHPDEAKALRLEEAQKIAASKLYAKMRDQAKDNLLEANFRARVREILGATV